MLAPLFFLTALVYSMVGLGGGSTYLALMAWFGVPLQLMSQTSLVCNVVVVSGGVWFFRKAGFLKWHLVLPFLISSIPFSFLGGRFPIEKKAFTLILAISLLIASLRLFWGEIQSRYWNVSRKHMWWLGVLLGAVLGFLSGVVGIGGGIYLAPLLILLGWADSKEAAAASSVFIFLNSCAGLVGQFQKSGILLTGTYILPLLIAVWLGGQIGSRIGAQHVSKLSIQRVSAALILFVSIRLFLSL